MADIFEESARLHKLAKQRLDIPLLGTEWSAPQCAFFRCCGSWSRKALSRRVV
jgi:hypothetical protein